MSQPLIDLQQILAERASVAGQVLSIANGVARVATASGVVELPFEGSVGDRVTVQDGKAVRVQASDDVPVFFV